MTEDIVIQLMNMVEVIRKGNDDLQMSVNSMHSDVTKRLDTIEAEQKIFREAFPGGDVEGHCRFHQDDIDRKSLNRKFKRAVIEKGAMYLLLAAFLWVGNAILHDLAATIKFIAGSK